MRRVAGSRGWRVAQISTMLIDPQHEGAPCLDFETWETDDINQPPEGFMIFRMARGLVRYQQCGCFHFVTFSCFHRLPHLGAAAARALFESALERIRTRYKMAVAGYVARWPIEGRRFPCLKIETWGTPAIGRALSPRPGPPASCKDRTRQFTH